MLLTPGIKWVPFSCVVDNSPTSLRNQVVVVSMQTEQEMRPPVIASYLILPRSSLDTIITPYPVNLHGILLGLDQA